MCGLLARTPASVVGPATGPSAGRVSSSPFEVIAPATNSVAAGVPSTAGTPSRPEGVTSPAKNVWMSPVTNVTS